jgi:hypothetical protein
MMTCISCSCVSAAVPAKQLSCGALAEPFLACRRAVAVLLNGAALAESCS